MRITTEGHLDDLLAPLAPGEAGHPVDDEADYVWLDQEMMKVSSLHHGGIDWGEVESRACALLSNVGKDLRVFGYLLHCLQRSRDGVRFALSLKLLAGCLVSCWESAHPSPGAAGEGWRRRIFEKFMRQAVLQAEALDFSNAEEEYQACRTAFESLEQVVEAGSLPSEQVTMLGRALERRCPDRRGDAGDSTSPKPTESTEASTSATPPASHQSAATPVSKLPELRLEAGNERDNRHALLNLADFLNARNPGDPLGYRLRRYAIWSAIHAPPSAGDDGRTVLAAPSSDRIREYREALGRGGGDVSLWGRIEHSLSVSPFWLEGHRLSAALADRLGHPRCADAIHDEARVFAEHMPELDALTFEDGTPFVDEETRRWMRMTDDSSGPAAEHGHKGEPWLEGLESARQCLAEDGLAAALSIMDSGVAAAASPREHVYWRMVSADLLREAGLSALACQHYRAVQEAVSGLGLEVWEPGLLARLERVLALCEQVERPSAT